MRITQSLYFQKKKKKNNLLQRPLVAQEMWRSLEIPTENKRSLTYGIIN